MSDFYNTTIERGGKEVEVAVQYDYTPYQEAKVRCLPEDATPAEPEDVSICDVMSPWKGSVRLTVAEHERITQEIIDHEYEKAEGDRGGYDDWVYECEKDRRLGL